LNVDLRELKELLAILDERGISEFEMEADGMKVRVRKDGGRPLATTAAPAPAAPPHPAFPAAAPDRAGASPAAAAAPAEEALVVVKSPIVGTFYRAPDPNSPPFVEVGDVVRVGQVLCIVEAMKLMNEIEAEAAGEVVKVHPGNGQAVQFGDPLFSLRPA
jgi:acetyl-CoA carboxylase biotin carboxyl carrier protein